MGRCGRIFGGFDFDRGNNVAIQQRGFCPADHPPGNRREESGAGLGLLGGQRFAARDLRSDWLERQMCVGRDDRHSQPRRRRDAIENGVAALKIGCHNAAQAPASGIPFALHNFFSASVAMVKSLGPLNPLNCPPAARCGSRLSQPR